MTGETQAKYFLTAVLVVLLLAGVGFIVWGAHLAPGSLWRSFFFVLGGAELGGASMAWLFSDWLFSEGRAGTDDQEED